MGVSAGQPYPLGAAWDGAGANFAIFSENATAVELCLFDGPDDAEESARIPITQCTDGVWHVYCAEVRPGQLYGYRVHGPYAPQEGNRFNPNKLLLDPYAKRVGVLVSLWRRRVRVERRSCREGSIPGARRS